MKDFKKATLYDNEIGSFKRFVDEILETQTEYNDWGRKRDYRKEDEDGTVSYIEGMDDFMTYDETPFDFSGGGFNSFESLIPVDFEQKKPFQQMLAAPFQGYVSVLDALSDKKKYGIGQKTDINFMKTWVFVGIGLGIFSLLGKTGLITTLIHWHIGVLLILSGLACDLLLHFKFKEKSVIIDLIDGNDEEEGEDVQEELEESDLEGEDDDFLGGFDFDFSNEDGIGQAESISDLYENEYEEEDDYEEDPEEMSKILEIFPESRIETSKDDGEKFRKTLIREFNSKQSKGEMLLRREEIFREFASFMPSNDKGFSKWYHPKERAVEYLNVAYTIYKALVEINNSFSLEKVENQKLTIIEMKRTPLLYKVTVKLPSFFKLNQMMGKEKVFVDMAKASDKDTEVGVLLTSFGGNLVVKFLKYDYRGIISMGDLIRMDDEDPTTDSLAEQIVGSKGLPLVAGLRNNEYPYMVDLEGNPAASIVGGTGSGKSWLTFQLVVSMLVTTSPEELNIMVMDAKIAAIWRQLALAPHVIGHHTDIWKFSEILDEINMEHQRRMTFLSENGVESWKELRNSYKKNGKHDELWKIPMLVVIIDEITYTMNTLAEQDNEMYKKVKSQLGSLSSVIRASGIRLILIGQRAIDTSIPKTYLANSPLKLGMKMNNISEFGAMFDKAYKNAPRIPSGPGEGLMLSEGQVELSYVKTVIPAGFDDGDVLMHLRTIALEWVRRTVGGDKDYLRMFNNGMEQTIKVGFNRNEFHIEALNALKEGRITGIKEVDKDYAGIDGTLYTSPQNSLTSRYKEELPKDREVGTTKDIKENTKDIKESTKDIKEDIEDAIADIDIDWGMLDDLVEEEIEYDNTLESETTESGTIEDDEFEWGNEDVWEDSDEKDEEQQGADDLNDNGLTLDDLFGEVDEIEDEELDEIEEIHEIEEKQTFKSNPDLKEVEENMGVVTLPTDVFEEMKRDMEERIRKDLEEETSRKLVEQVEHHKRSIENKYKKKLNKEKNLSALKPDNFGNRTYIQKGNDAKNMGIDEYIYENGEVVEENGVNKYRVTEGIIKAIYNKKKIEIATLYGSIYYEDGYYYVTI